MTHDPPFVKHSTKNIPLIHSIEHPTIEAIEFMRIIEDYQNIIDYNQKQNKNN